MRATRADVAKKAGVSVATVSYVLNNTCPVKDETRDKVLAAVRVLNYIPDLRARSMATNRTMQIAVIVSSLSDPVSCEIVEHFIHKAAQNGYFVSISIKIGNIIQNIRNVISQHMDGVFILSTPGEMESDMVYSLTDTELRAVMGVPLLSEASKQQVCSIEIARNEALLTAAAYLGEKGHTRIAYLSSVTHENGQKEILSLFQKKKKNMPQVRCVIDMAKCSDDFETGRILGRRFIKRYRTGYTAVLTPCEEMVRGCMAAFSECGLQIPQDISCMTLKTESVPQTPNDLTAMVVNYRQFAEKAFDMLQNFIDGNLISHYRLPCELREGKTVSIVTGKGTGRP